MNEEVTTPTPDDTDDAAESEPGTEEASDDTDAEEGGEDE